MKKYNFNIEFSGNAEITIKARTEQEAQKILNKYREDITIDWGKAPKSVVDISEDLEILGDVEHE